MMIFLNCKPEEVEHCSTLRGRSSRRIPAAGRMNQDGAMGEAAVRRVVTIHLDLPSNQMFHAIIVY
jgi:hypothetical protein